MKSALLVVGMFAAMLAGYVLLYLASIHSQLANVLVFGGVFAFGFYLGRGSVSRPPN